MRQGVFRYPLRWAAVGLVSLLALKLALPPAGVVLPLALFLPLHTLLEFIAIAVSGTIGVLAWSAHTRRYDNDLLLGSAFLIAAAADFLHVLSYVGMPDLLSPNSADKSIHFWLWGRSIVMLALLVVALRPWQENARLRLQRGVALAGTALLLAISWLGLDADAPLPSYFTPATGLSTLKVGWEYSLAGGFLVAALLLAWRARRHRHLAGLAAASGLMAMSESCLTGYSTPTDVMNLAGHVFKTAAYVLVGQVFARRMAVDPLYEAEHERQLLQAVFDVVPVGLAICDQRAHVLACNRAAQEQVGAERGRFIGWKMFLPGAKVLDVEGREVVPEMLPTQRAARGEVLRNVELEISQGAVTRWLSISTTPIISPRGEPGVVSCYVDATERRKADAQLRLSANVFEHSGEGILIADAQFVLVDVNPALCQITGYTREALIGQSVELLRAARMPDDFFPGVQQRLAQRPIWRGECWLRRRDGGEVPVLISIGVVRDSLDRLSRYVAQLSDISRIKAQQDDLERQAYHDPLTSLPNRLLLDDRLHLALSNAQRKGNLVAVGYLDLDGFKAINDLHGHAAGDVLLIGLAQRLRDLVRAGDTVARLGGDEFVFVLGDLGPDEAWHPVLDRMLEAMRQPVHVDGLALTVSASIGVAMYPQHGQDPEQLLRRADEAMYQAKQAGRNGWFIHGSASPRSAVQGCA